jgi:hypothetical protein
MKLSDNMKKEIIKILKKRNVHHASVFGSFARGDATEKSDIDILVEPAKKSLFELAGIKNELEQSLGVKIDINTFNGLNYSNREGLKEEVLREQVKLL